MTSAGMLSEEEYERLNRKLNKLSTGMKVRIFYHKSFHDSESVGRLNCVDCEYGFLILDHERIYLMTFTVCVFWRCGRRDSFVIERP